ncbi:fimbrial biogenesis chaperone [Sphingobacterium paucimobilis]|uniref:Molecular chaperone n=1 Tax=Sphingobacterium paucimobilis HER1398 TaxID=1346330 RepID=U2JFE6_9SPHI|nr:hypothetical protein [Sphingobacterium paucimobilis]ERJ61403.1 hypothetical protein M472_21845 [Sphingobacterium paucimobilis HER1398]
MRYCLFTFLLNTFIFLSGNAQTGLTVGPPRVYFVADGGQNQTQYVDVTNPSKDYPLDLAVSFEDWEYSVLGDNVLGPKGSLKTSCADWLTVSEPFFSLKPGETKRLQLQMSVPVSKKYTEELPVHTTMLFVTQLNPRISEEREGANIRLAVRSGIKIYQRFNGRSRADIEISNLEYQAVDSIGRYLELSFETGGNTWVEGQLRVEFLNQDTGNRYKIDDIQFYSLPGDQRKQYILLPKEMTAGNYLATTMLFYGEDNDVKIAEIEFDYVPKM